MSVILRNVQIPLFIKIETGVLQQIRAILDEHHLHFQKPLIITNEHILELGGKDVVHELNDCAIVLVKENSMAEAERIATEVREKGNDVMISIGGGRILDVGKYAATKAGVNYISIPTSPSNDGISSPVAVLKNSDGITESLGVNMPVGILVDTSIMQSAPEDNVRAGIGDLISNFSAIADWKLAHTDGKDSMDDFAASMSFSAAQLVYETCRGTRVELTSEDFLSKLTHGLILSGIAMNIAGSSRPCSGAEHKVSHAIDALYPGTSFHGLQVAYGTLLTTQLRGESTDHLIDFYASVGLPTSHTDLGLAEEQLVEILLKAPETRSERYTILEKIGMKRADVEQFVSGLSID
jgi:glycerol-1-phosphate dehydrogenase [NAD(P)+]